MRTMRATWFLLPSLLAALPSTHAAGDAPAGKEIFQRWCAACHAEGPGHPGTQALDAIYQGSMPAALELRTNLDAAFIKYHVRHGRSTMPFFRKSEISDRELDELAAYLVSSPKPAAGP